MSRNHSAAGPGLRPYIAAALAVAGSYVLFLLVLGIGEPAVRRLMLIGVLLCFLPFLYKGCKARKFSAEDLIAAVIAAGIVMRIGYMLYTPILARGHDIGSWDSSGHLGYMYRIFETWSLPATNHYQFYHPPFQHIVQALVVRLFSLFQPGAGTAALFESARIVPCFASCGLLFVCRSICEEMGLSRRAAAIALALVAFHPAFLILSASVNNDALMLFFFMTAVLYTIRWYKSPTMKHILLIAVSIGLSMMTKVSGGIAALFTGPVFLIALVQALREKRARPLAGQLAAFALVCIPLALWYPVRNYILFGQPLGYVLKIGSDSPLYCGGRTVAERFLSFPFNEIIDPLYCQPFGDYRIWLYTLKCSVFGEFTFGQAPVLGAGLIVTNLMMILVSLGAMAYVMARGREIDPFARFWLLGIWLAQVVSFIAFNLRYPFGCTMDFRYIMPTVIIGAVYTGIALDLFKKKKTALWRGLHYLGCAACGLFCAASLFFYAV